MTWREFLRERRGRLGLGFCLIVLVLMVTSLPTYYQEVIAPRPGILLDDVFLDAFTPRDWSTAVFALLLAAIFQTLIKYTRTPSILMVGLTTYCTVNVLRTATMYWFTLEPPVGMILLVDPISASLVYPQNTFAKDLFFSGHVSTMVVMTLVETSAILRIAKALATTIMAFFLAWQHVHYTVDLVVAPLATYGIYLMVKRFYAPMVPASKLG